MKKINFSNGSGRWFYANEASEALKFAEENGISWQAIVNMMDDEAREDIFFDMAPCSEAKFLAEYLYRAKTDLIIG